jgi:hypothetical protein
MPQWKFNKFRIWDIHGSKYDTTYICSYKYIYITIYICICDVYTYVYIYIYIII